MDRLALDLDGTLAATVQTYIDEVLGNTVKKENIMDYDFKDHDINFQHFLKYSDQLWEQAHEVIKPLEHRPDNATAKLSEFYHIDIVTARPKVEDSIKNWLEMHNITYDNILYSIHDKQDLKYDLYIDDNPYLAENLPDNKILVYNQPWNQDLDDKYTHIDTLEDAADKAYKNIINND